MSDDKKPFHNPFATALGHLRDERAVEPLAAEAPPPVRAASGIPRAIVRLERRGRGGKVVTVVEHLALDEPAREQWLMALKGALGCGGTIENNALVLQGDQRGRLPKLLTTRGVKKVTIG